MRLATITNWAYGVTVALTLMSGATMILASNAQDRERAAVEQRYRLDKATEQVAEEVLAQTDRVRQYLDTGDATYRFLYLRDVPVLGAVEHHISALGDAGASADELSALTDAKRWADTLRDEQKEAIASFEGGEEKKARSIMFGAEYERELDRVRSLIERFQYRLDQRTEAGVTAAAATARIWKRVSEAVLAVTALLFMFVLFFVFRQRVLKPVVRLSDVMNSLAAHDFAVDPPDIGRIDEIGDMARTIRVFRENGLERQRLQEERDHDRKLRDLLSRMTQRMQGCDSLHDMEQIARRFIPEIAPDMAGRLYLIDAGRNAVVEACHWLDPGASRSEFSPAACWALRRGLPHRPIGGTIDVPCDHLDVEGELTVDSLCLPLGAHGETFGLLYFERKAEPSGVAPTSETYLVLLAENVGLAIGNIRLREQLQAMAMGDALTGLGNRRQLDARLDQILGSARQSNQPISCLMADVDHFKQFNDSFGHHAGDIVLREVGAALAGAVRDKELAFRYGGEEFMVLLPGCDADRAVARAQDIRERIAALDLKHDGRQLRKVAISVGVATGPVHCALERLVHTADAALLRAKAKGRDRIEVAAVRGCEAA